MTSHRRSLGRFGEAYARAHLAKHGYRILGTNVRLPSGEIDIVAKDGEVLVMVEVRTRRGDRYGTPEESITPAKAGRLIDLGYEYIVQAEEPHTQWRVDIVAIDVDGAGKVSRIEVYKQALGE